MSKIPFICWSAAALLMLSGCGSTSLGNPDPAAATSSAAGGAGGNGSSADPDAVTQADSPPPVETNGTDPAGPTQGSRPAVNVAGLPIGSGGNDGTCLTLAFRGSAAQLPAGVRLVDTAVYLDGVAVHTPACPGQDPGCVGLTVTADTAGNGCSVVIDGGTDSSDSTSEKVVLKAALSCPADQLAACAQFLQTLQSEQAEQDAGQPVTVNVQTSADASPSSPADGSSGGSSDSSSSTDSSSDSSSSSSSG